MSLVKFVARVGFIVTLAVVLNGCITEVGNQRVPLMKPGHGLVATSVILQSPNSAALVKFGHFQARFRFTYQLIGGEVKDQFVLSNERDSAVMMSKTARTAEDDAMPALLLSSAKPGKYRLREARISPYPHRFDAVFFLVDQPVIDVVEGQLTYAGSMRLRSSVQWGAGKPTVNSIAVETENDFAIDVAELKLREERLSSVPIKNALAP